MPDLMFHDISAWAAYFEHAHVPVLTRSISELAALQQREDDITGRDLSAAILHDPLLTVQVLQYLQLRNRATRSHEITTIAHAVMMMGITPFFRDFSDMVPLEPSLDGWPAAREGVLRVISRARHAALLAREFASYRHDVESDEVVIAALLHDLAEMLLWCVAPSQMLALRALRESQPTMRSQEAQRQILGFPAIDLQRLLVRSWHLPTLLADLMDHSRADQPRVRNVVLAVDLSRHLANGWDDPALADDYKALRALLPISEDELRHAILRASLHAAHDWQWYGVPPSLARRPLSSV